MLSALYSFPPRVLLPTCKFLVCISVVFIASVQVFGGKSVKTDSLIQEVRKIMMGSPDRAEALLNPALAFALDNKAYADAVPLLHQLAIIAMLKGDPIRRQTLNREALIYATLSGDRMLMANCLTKLAKDYKNAGKPDSTAACCLEAIIHYNAISKEGYAWACHTMLGDIAQDAGRFVAAEPHYLKAWEVVQSLHDPKEEFIVAGILQHYYITTGQEEKYAGILEQLLMRNPYFIDEIHKNNAHYHTLLLAYAPGTDAVDDLKKSNELNRRLNHSTSMLAGMMRLGKLLTMDGRYAEGYDTLKEAFQFTSSYFPSRMRLYYMLYENRHEAGDHKAALEHYIQYQTIKDSINTETATAHIRELEVQYNTKENELALLQAREHARKKTNQRNMALISLAGIIWFSLFGILFYWNRARLHRKLAMQHEILHQQKINQLEQEKKLLAMSSMIGGQEVERKRIARDLHDGLGGLLSSVKATLNIIQHQVVRLESKDLYQKANALIDTASTELRRIAYNMMPSSLSRLGLDAALEDLCATLEANHGLQVDLQIFGLQKRLDETTEIMLYRIIQELCNNVVKHAKATRLLIQINRVANELFLIVEDNGIGMEPGTLDRSNGIGMKSVESRVKFLNGTIDISTGPGKGTCMTMHFPDQHMDMDAMQDDGKFHSGHQTF